MKDLESFMDGTGLVMLRRRGRKGIVDSDGDWKQREQHNLGGSQNRHSEASKTARIPQKKGSG